MGKSQAYKIILLAQNTFGQTVKQAEIIDKGDARRMEGWNNTLHLEVRSNR